MAAATNKWDAGLYDDKHAFVWEKAKGVMDLLAPQAGERILDLGCGTGALTAEIAASGASVLGVDRSGEMVDGARRKFKELRFEVVDACKLEFAEEFDAVFSNAVLHWIKEPERVIVGVSRALRPGGRFVAEFGGEGNVQGVVDSVAGAFAKFGVTLKAGANPWYYPSVKEYSGLLEKHGFTVRGAELFDRPTKLEDGEKGLENWLRMFAGFFLGRVPEEWKVEFLKEVEKQAKPRLWKDGSWVLDYRRLRIAAVRK